MLPCCASHKVLFFISAALTNGKHKIIKHIYVALAVHCVSYLLPNYPVVRTTRSGCWSWLWPLDFMFSPTQQTRSQRGCNSICPRRPIHLPVNPRRPIHLPVNPRRPIHLPVNKTVNSRSEQETQNAAVLCLTQSAALRKCRNDRWETQNYQAHSCIARRSLRFYLLPNHPVALTLLGLAVTLNRQAVKHTDIKCAQVQQKYAKSCTMR